KNPGREYTLFISVFVCTLALVSHGQQNFSDDQYFKDDFSPFIQPLPNIVGWKDGVNAIMVKDKKTFLLNASTGKEIEYKEAFEPRKEYEAQLKPIIKTRNKDLYVEIKGKETRLTSDTF